ncbi:hypothetical protein CR513_09160, partial [Mucuna pruriens]
MKKAKCNYYHHVLKGNHKTSSINTHVRKCKSNPNNEVIKRLKSTSLTANISSPSLAKFDHERVKIIVKFELSKYLEEDLEKVNSSRFPILGNIERKILTIFISIMSFESAFSNKDKSLIII